MSETESPKESTSQQQAMADLPPFLQETMFGAGLATSSSEEARRFAQNLTQLPHIKESPASAFEQKACSKQHKSY